jgi:hypothetical protein
LEAPLSEVLLLAHMSERPHPLTDPDLRLARGLDLLSLPGPDMATALRRTQAP